MAKEYYTYQQLTDDMKILADQVKDLDIQMIIPITRGGLVPACHLGYLLGIKNYQVLCLNSYHGTEQTDMNVINVPKLDDIPKEKILVVDSMVDRGTTLAAARQIIGPEAKYLTIHLKPYTTEMPDFYLHVTSEWVVYPWDYES